MKYLAVVLGAALITSSIGCRLIAASTESNRTETQSNQTNLQSEQATSSIVGSSSQQSRERTAPRRLPSPSEGVRYSGSGGGHWVKEKLDRGRYILLEDGSLWEVASVDRVYSSLWLRTESITVIENEDGVLPYRLINTDSKDIVEAKLLSLR